MFQDPLNLYKPWDIAPPSRTIYVDAVTGINLYIYDPRPLDHVQIGQTALVHAVVGDVSMTSPITGTSFDTRIDQLIAFSYNGTIFGAASIDKEVVREAAENGYFMRFVARCDGYLPEFGNSFKAFTLFVPGNGCIDIYTPIEKDKAIQAGAPQSVFVKHVPLYEENHFGRLAARDKWEELGVRLEFMPVGEKSKAKPTLGVLDREGNVLFEVGPGRKVYKELATIGESYRNIYLFARREKLYGGSVSYGVDLLYW